MPTGHEKGLMKEKEWNLVLKYEKQLRWDTGKGTVACRNGMIKSVEARNALCVWQKRLGVTGVCVHL